MMSYKQYLLSEYYQDEEVYKTLRNKIDGFITFIVDQEISGNSSFYDEYQDDPDYVDIIENTLRNMIIEDMLEIYNDISGEKELLTDKEKWTLIKYDPKNIAIIRHPSKEMQEYICIHNPDLIVKINNLDLELKKRYKNDLNLASISL